jgi:hypothetical protein
VILKDLPCITFVLALSRKSPIDVAKLCDHIELLPQMNVQRVRDILRTLHTHCEADFDFIRPSGHEQNADPLELNAAHNGLLSYLRAGAGEIGSVQAIASLLPTPRLLKHLIRRVDRVWTSLYGEVHLNDLIILSALREGAQPLLIFF